MMTPLEARLTQENEALRQEVKLLREKIDLLEPIRQKVEQAVKL
jgi:cell division protein FtsB